MNVATAKRVGIVAGAIMGVIGVVAAARPLLISDAPPWASKMAVTDSASMIYKEIGVSSRDILARLAAGNMLAMQTRYCEAVTARNIAYAQSLAATISMLQAEYRGYVGYDYTLPPCI